VRHSDLLQENCAIARSAGIVGERWVWLAYGSPWSKRNPNCSKVFRCPPGGRAG